MHCLAGVAGLLLVLISHTRPPSSIFRLSLGRPESYITLYVKRTWRSKNDTWVSFCFIACKTKFCAHQFGFSAALMTHIQRNLLSFWDKQLDKKIRLQPTSYFLSAIIKMCRKLSSWLWSWKERCWRIFFRVLCFNVKRWLFFPTLQSTKKKKNSKFNVFHRGTNIILYESTRNRTLAGCSANLNKNCFFMCSSLQHVAGCKNGFVHLKSISSASCWVSSVPTLTFAPLKGSLEISLRGE